MSDPLVTPIVQRLLVCFQDQLTLTPSPPANVGVRTGEAGGPLISPNVDECCEGLGWIRVVNVFPSFEAFPAPQSVPMNCAPEGYAIVLEMGVARCMPWGSGVDSLDPPTQADWDQNFANIMEDAAAMRRAVNCCFGYPTFSNHILHNWTPLPIESGCTGSTQQVTVQAIACNECGG